MISKVLYSVFVYHTTISDFLFLIISSFASLNLVLILVVPIGIAFQLLLPYLPGMMSLLAL